MRSKMILDSERLLEEELISPTDACREFPGGRSRPALERYMRKGICGVILESVLVCGKRYTSREAVNRFIRNQLHTENERPPPRQGSIPPSELEKRSRRLRLPESQ